MKDKIYNEISATIIFSGIIVMLLVFYTSFKQKEIDKIIEKSKYSITLNQSRADYTNNFIAYDDSCIEFISNKNNKEIFFCGSYKIVEN